MLGCADCQHGAGEPPGEALEDASPLNFSERCRRTEIEAELHPRVSSVDALPARAGRVRELFNQLSRRNRESAGRTGAGGHVQIVHTPSLPHTA